MSGQITGITTLSGTTGKFETVLTTNNTNLAVPSTGIYGGLGDKLIFTLGGIIEHPYSIGRYTNELWYSIPSTASHKFYCGGLNRFSIDSLGNVTASGNLNGTTGIFGTVSTTNNTNVNTPATGLSGGTGDKIIISSGGTGVYPYSIGRNTNVLWYSAPTGASHNFYSGGTNTLTIDSTGNITANSGITLNGTLRNAYWQFTNESDYCRLYGAGTTNYFKFACGDIDTAGGIAINGNTAIYDPFASVDAGNKTNTYINFKQAGSTNDWCYIRQIGGDNIYKLAFDFHDDADDARFCIRSVQSAANPDVIKEVFTVDNGNITCSGTITNGSSSYIFAGGLRIGGFDPNSLYSGAKDLGLTCDNGKSINLNIWGGNGTIFSINNNNSVSFKPLQIYTDVTNNSLDLYCYPSSINNQNGANRQININAVCNTTGTARSPIINCIVADGWNGINTIVTLACSGGANSGYSNGSRIILDGSYAKNAASGAYGSTINFQSQTSSGWTDNAIFRTYMNGSVVAVGFYFYGTVYYYALSSLLSDKRTKKNIRNISNALDKIDRLNGVLYTSDFDADKRPRMGLLAQEVEKVAPEVISVDEKGYMGVCYSSLVGLLVEGIKELNIKVKDQQKQINELKNILIKNNLS